VRPEALHHDDPAAVVSAPIDDGDVLAIILAAEAIAIDLGVRFEADLPPFGDAPHAQR
jgi:hypothetical protein